MSRDPFHLASLSLALAAAFLAGCGDKPAPKGAPAALAAAHEDHQAPHGGSLLELGEEEAHVELVHDVKSGTLEAYVYGRVIGTPAFVEAPTILVAGKSGPEEIRPTAVDARADGTASQWKVTDARLATDPLDGRIRVKVDGKTFQSPLEPAGHGH
jgi:hypothetical protein